MKRQLSALHCPDQLLVSDPVFYDTRRRSPPIVLFAYECQFQLRASPPPPPPPPPPMLCLRLLFAFPSAPTNTSARGRDERSRAYYRATDRQVQSGHLSSYKGLSLSRFRSAQGGPLSYKLVYQLCVDE